MQKYFLQIAFFFVAFVANCVNNGAMSTLPEKFRGCRVLIVEDVLPLSIQYRAFIKSLEVEVVTAATIEQAKRQIDQGIWHAALIDINLPDGSGFDVMKVMTAKCPTCAVVVISAEDSIENAVRAAHAGAMDFIEKPIDPDRLLITMRNALQTSVLANKVEALSTDKKDKFCSFIGSSAVMQAVYKTIETVAQSRVPVFIYGESGTGKELAADAIHRSSSRVKRPFIALNCAAIPKDLIESELFGHVKGSFSGATVDRNGAFIEADQGTLFLDEIAEMDINVQAKLLRVLQTGEVRRVGEMKHRSVDVRIVCASHRDLYTQVKAGLFREDLFYRLYVVSLELPPLKDRGHDVMQIAQAMLERYSREDGKQFQDFSPQAATLLATYDWPGNVRELINVIRATVALNDGPEVTVDMLPAQLQRKPLDPHASPAVASEANSRNVATARVDSVSPSDILTLAQVERQAIERAMQILNGNISRVAKALGVNASTLYRKMNQWM
ncbi:MAG: sigma-54 factor interaction protein [Pseudomonadota bacterium]